MLADLDGPLCALVRDDPDLLAPLVARQGEVRSLLAFTDAERARAHLEALPPRAGGGWTVAALEPDDWRGKEELLRAAATLGATRLELDPGPDLATDRVLPLAKAIAYVGSYKRATACL